MTKSPFEETLPPLLTRQEVAARLGIHPNTVRNLEKTGSLPVLKVGPRLVRYKESDIDQYIKSQAFKWRLENDFS